MKRGLKKKRCACFVTSQYVQNQFPPPKQDVHNMLARPQLKGAKTPSVVQYVQTINRHLNYREKVENGDSNRSLCLTDCKHVVSKEEK